jgi:hypothetical protein
METRSKPQQKNLWFSLLFIFLGALQLRLAFYVDSKTQAIILLAGGAILVLAAIVIFWKNFRE